MNRIDGTLFSEMIYGGAANLRQNRQTVNDLNVFPIPDGDTGDNMFMTINSGAAQLRTAGVRSLSDAAKTAARGMLLGARGNSGVILSRIFAGIADGLNGLDSADVKAYSSALENGIRESYSAVAHPVEGTVLTVYREAVEYASSRITEQSSIGDFFDSLLTEMRFSLERTPTLLEVLRESGVVDSGGAGLIYITEGMKNALCGEKTVDEGDSFTDNKKAVDISLFTEDSVLDYGYCTEFLLRLQRSKVDIDTFDLNVISDHLNSVGNSLVIFRDGTVVKVHVHTMNPGDILNYCQQFGEFLTLKIENMTLEHSEATIKSGYTPPSLKPKKKYGIVSVAAGDGIKDMFRSLGCDAVVDGGQSMNPSAEDFLRAFGEINADTIFVFPNNSNIILTANQAAEMYDKADVRVIPTKTVGEGYATVSMLDTASGDTDAIIEDAESVISEVTTGTVSRASRDTEKDGIEIHSGDFIGFSDKKIYVDSPERNSAAEALADSLNAGKYDIMILICGEDATDEDADELYRKFKSKYRKTEIIMLNGGQPIYDYIITLE